MPTSSYERASDRTQLSKTRWKSIGTNTHCSEPQNVQSTRKSTVFLSDSVTRSPGFRKRDDVHGQSEKVNIQNDHITNYSGKGKGEPVVQLIAMPSEIAPSLVAFLHDISAQKETLAKTEKWSRRRFPCKVLERNGAMFLLSQAFS
jgi:hypothetical protein